jgi:hypothetical protein
MLNVALALEAQKRSGEKAGHIATARVLMTAFSHVRHVSSSAIGCNAGRFRT